ncbi:MAG TPA: TetR/AcrR family transcriptional regulator [Saprospiraceae bacterium]|nr:TetR/AcrR family transcriptional regulator [Saprospiraceae bacterium]HMP23102.1 TetR/AcrR family transcriptional regulator [Saprospiraceae bacterium]
MPKDVSTEEKILAAAKQVFLRDGYHGARMETIAKEADVNKALLHYYFRSKDKLFEQIFQQLKGGLLPRVSEIFKSDIPLFDKIRLFVSDYIDLLLENPYVPLFLVNEINKNPEKFMQSAGIFEKVQSFMPYFIVQLQDEIEKGNIRPIHPMHLLMNTMSMCAFPFLGKPMLQRVVGMSDAQYMSMMQERKQIVADFIINSLKV